MPDTIEVKVEDYVPGFIQLAKNDKGSLLMANTLAAVKFLAMRYQETWQSAASGTPLSGLPFIVNGKEYPNTIQSRQISDGIWEVFSDYATNSGLGVTALLEKGHGVIDLKPGLLSGPKSRTGKKGRYNIVAFQHGVPGTDALRNSPMPESVYTSFKKDTDRINAMKKAGSVTIRGGTSYRSQAGTQWGSRYNPASQIGRQTKLITEKGKRKGEYTWKSGKYAGMVRMEESTEKAKRSAYMTFRVVSVHSDPNSWKVPERPPWPVRNAVIDTMRPIAEEIMKSAIEADMR